MKKLLAIICAMALVLLALGVLAGCSGVREVNVDKLLRKCTDHRELQVADGSAIAITVDTDCYSVYVEEIDYGSAVTVDYIARANSEVTATKDGNIVITQRSAGQNANGKDAFLIVGIPERLMRQQLVLIVTCAVGSIQLDDISASSITATAKVGSVLLEGCHATYAELQTGTGAIYAEMEGDSLMAATETGEVRFELEVKNISITTGTGQVRGTVEHPMHWYTVTAQTGTGRNNLAPRTSDSGYKLTISVGTGNINVRFDND